MTLKFAVCWEKKRKKKYKQCRYGTKMVLWINLFLLAFNFGSSSKLFNARSKNKEILFFKISQFGDTLKGCAICKPHKTINFKESDLFPDGKLGY